MYLLYENVGRDIRLTWTLYYIHIISKILNLIIA